MALERVIPTPKEAEYSQQMVLVDNTWGIVDQSRMQGMAERYADTFGVARRQGQRSFTLSADAKLAEEEYRLEVSAEGVTVAASSRRGFLHAISTLNQLRNGPMLQIAKVHDYPRLPMRGVQLMFESFLQMGLKEALDLVRSAAKFKLNTLLLEFGDRFPFARHSAISSPSALSQRDVQQIVETAHSLGMQTIPLLQSLGHLRYMLKHDRYADIREEQGKPDQMCPTNEQSFRVWTELAEEVLEQFHGSRLMHIGADETRQLGVCPRCRQEAAEGGKGGLYLHHVNKVCAWLADRGVTPIIWDDILCAHPTTMVGLHESAWVMYWDYWTTSSPSPLVVARYASDHALIYDRGWDGEWKHELSDATRSTLDFFGHAVSMENDLSAEFRRVYGKYLGDQLPKFVRAFPYLEYYQDHGRTVIGGPTCSGNTSEWLSLPDFPRYGTNIKAFADRCAEAKARGEVTTSWYNRPHEVVYFGLLATGQATW